MAARYAETTRVPVEQSRREVERTLARYGANGFSYGWDQRIDVKPAVCTQTSCNTTGNPIAACRAAHSWLVRPERRETRELVVIAFRFKDRMVRLDVPMPTLAEVGGTKEKHERATRQRWRALALVIKAKLEAVEAGISTLEHEFLADIVTADGMTIGDKLVPRLSEAVQAGRLLPAAGEGSAP